MLRLLTLTLLALAWAPTLRAQSDTLPPADTAGAALGEVVISGTLRSVRRLESPIAVEVYNAGFFKKNPAPSLFEGLQCINGVRPQINCSVCATGDIHINGLEGPYTMVTIDGMPIVSALGSVYGLFGIPTALIERVEVVKGPASGLYGPEAIGGLINVITKNPGTAPRFSASSFYTGHGELNVDLGFAPRHRGRLRSLTGLHYFRFNQPLDGNRDGFTDLPLQHRVSLFQKWDLQRRSRARKGLEATLAARYFYEDRWGGELRWTPAHRGGSEVYGESIRTHRWELIGRYSLQPGLTYSVSATAHRQDSRYGATAYLGSQDILYQQLIRERTLGSHALLGGLALRYNRYDDNSTATRDTISGKSAPERVWIPAVFLQDEWKLGGGQTILTGLRWDHHPVHHSIITPRVAYKIGLDERTVLRLNGGTGFRVVNLFTEDHAALTGARAVEIREALKPEQSLSFSFNGVREWMNPYASFRADLSLWTSRFRNQIIADYSTDPQKIIYDNLRGHARSRGISLNLDGHLRQRFRYLIGGTVQDVFKEEEGGRERPVLTEGWSGTWALSYEFQRAGLVVDYTGNIYGSMRLPLLGPLDPRPEYAPVWSQQNLQFTWKGGKGWEAFGGIKNLLDWTPAKGVPFLIARAHDPFDRGVDWGPDGQPQRTSSNPYALSFDPSYSYAPNQGRRVFIGFRFTGRG